MNPQKLRISPASTDPHKNIYINRDLRLDTVRSIGFDMDYTLARYNKHTMELLSYQLTMQQLIEMGYPKALCLKPYNPNFAIRGLTIDKMHGNICKLNRHKYVTRAYHGTAPLSKTQRRALYRQNKISISKPRFEHLDSLFAAPEVAAFATVIDGLPKNTTEETFRNAFIDTRTAIDKIHRDNSLKSYICQDFHNFIDYDPQLIQLLNQLRQNGHHLFLLTNSDWSYTNQLMSFILGNGTSSSDHWTEFFDLVVVDAKKPKFFEQQSDIHPRLFENKQSTTTKIVSNASMKWVENAIGCKEEEILYIGDHIYADILRSKKDAAWRTMLILEELNTEIDSIIAHSHLRNKLNHLEEQRQNIDSQPPSNSTYKLPQIIAEITDITSQLEHACNPYWGMLLKDKHELSYFGSQVEKYACLYTSRATNLLGYISQPFLHRPHRNMAHEI